jgi:hypothetical protein
MEQGMLRNIRAMDRTCVPSGVCVALSSAVCSVLLLLIGALAPDRRNMTGTPAGVSGQLRRLCDMEGVEGEVP